MQLYDAIISAFKKQFGRKPNPIEFAHNIPTSASDSDAMLAMVRMMEDKS